MSVTARNQPQFQAGFALFAQETCPYPLGQAGLWSHQNDPSTLLWRREDGTDAIVSSAAAPVSLAVTKTAAALAGSPVYDNGTDGVGATLTRGSNGAIGTVGGLALTSSHVGQFVVVNDQVSTFQNGLYELVTLGSGSAPYVLRRAVGWDAAIRDGALVAVQLGTYAGRIFNQTETVATVGTDAVSFSQIAEAVTEASVRAALAVAAGAVDINGQALTGVASVDGDTGSMTVGAGAGTTALTIGKSTIPVTFQSPQAAGATTNVIPDPGTGAAIPVTTSGSVPLTIGSAGAETNTLAIPTFAGQVLDIFADTVGTGSRAITASQAINQTGNTVMTFAQAADYVRLVAITVGGALRWRVAANDGVTLS